MTAVSLSFTALSCDLLNKAQTVAAETQFMPVSFSDDGGDPTTYYLIYDTEKKVCPTDKVWERADFNEGDTTDASAGTYVVGNKYTYTLGTIPTSAMYSGDSAPSATLPGQQFAGWFLGGSTLSENFNTDGIWFKDGYTLSYTAKGYTYTARYNKTKSVKPQLGDIAIERASRTTTTENFVTLSYTIAEYAPCYDDLAAHYAGVVIYNGEVYTDDTTKDTETTIIMGLNGKSNVRWAVMELPQNSFDPSTLNLDRAVDKTGANNYDDIKTDAASMSSVLNIEVSNLEAFVESGKYASENNLTQTAFLDWYIPSSIEFEIYLNGNKLATAISASAKAGGSINQTGGLWTSSLDQVREHNYYACYYNSSLQAIHCTSVTQEKSAIFFLQIKDPS